MGTLIEVLAKSDKLKAISEAIKVAGLVETLNSDGPYTFLAPTDGAVAQISKSIFKSLLENKETLAKVVEYHILFGSIDTDKLHELLRNSATAEINTLEGYSVVFRSTGVLKKHFRVNDSTVLSTDIRAENGLIHTVDSVLFPPNLSI